MPSKQASARADILYAFATNCAILFVGMGLFPVLPLYAADLGASPTVVGLFLGLTSATITAGTVAFGWLAARISHRLILAAAGAVGIPSLFLMAHVTAVWQLAALTGIVWFAGGVGLSLVSVLTSLTADQAHRGRSFSLMGLALPLATVLGGFSVSRLIALGGYATMFTVVSASWLLIPLFAWRLSARPLPGRKSPAAPASGGGARLNRTFYAFMLAALLATAAINIGRMGTSLSMRALNFTPSEVANTSTISGLLAIPVMLLLGPLTDRFNRRHMLAVNYAALATASVMLTMASELWHFWLATTLLLVGRTASSAVAAAYVTDLLAAKELIRGLPRLNMTNWATGIVAFAASGYVVDTLGLTTVYALAGFFAVLAIVQIEALGRQLRRPRRLSDTARDLKRATQPMTPVRTGIRATNA